MNSGSVIPAQDVDHPKAQKIYDQVVAEAGCGGQADTLNCLRGVSYTKLLNAANSVPGLLSYRSVDLSYLPRPDPSDNFFPLSPELATGRIAKVPVIIGDQEDEGTLFALFQSNVTTTSELVDYLASYFPDATRADIQGLVDIYPQAASAGSPFRTGILYSLYPQFKRLAAILGDATFTLTRRAYLDTISPQVKSWSYLSSYFYGLPFLGTGHGTDILPLFFNFNIPSNPANSILTYYIQFVNSLDPGSVNGLQWPQYDTSTRKLLNFELLSNSIMEDDFRSAQFQYLSQRVSTFQVRR
jgi:carboxylesterase type B